MRYLLALLGLALGLSLLSPSPSTATTPEAGTLDQFVSAEFGTFNQMLIAFTPVVTCRGDQKHGYGTVNAGPPWKSAKYSVSITHGYEKCRNKLGPQWIRPRWQRGSVYASGRTHVNCYSYPGEVSLQRFRFTTYFSHDGRNQRKTFAVPCEGDASFTRLVRFSKRHTVAYPLPYSESVRARTIATGEVYQWNDRSIQLSGARLDW